MFIDKWRPGCQIDNTKTKMSQGSSMAMKTWELQNNIEVEFMRSKLCVYIKLTLQTVSSTDDIYKYEQQGQQDMLAAKPWIKEYAWQTGMLNV